MGSALLSNKTGAALRGRWWVLYCLRGPLGRAVPDTADASLNNDIV